MPLICVFVYKIKNNLDFRANVGDNVGTQRQTTLTSSGPVLSCLAAFLGWYSSCHQEYTRFQ